jgi:hypothetical protein
MDTNNHFFVVVSLSLCVHLYPNMSGISKPGRCSWASAFLILKVYCHEQFSYHNVKITRWLCQFSSLSDLKNLSNAIFQLSCISRVALKFIFASFSCHRVSTYLSVGSIIMISSLFLELENQT